MKLITNITMATPKPLAQAHNHTDICRLLSLPKELRLEIWRYTVAQPSTELILRIDQGHTESTLDSPPTYQRCSNAIRQYTRFQTSVKATLEPRLSCTLGSGVLGVNKLVYQEALPLLYRPITFAPSSMFGEFLDALSEFAKSHVCRVRLKIDDFTTSEQRFNWTVLCAQVATLPHLRRVEVQRAVKHPSLHSRSTKRLLKPLLRIKAPKVLVSEDDDAFQNVLGEVEKEMDAEKTARLSRVQVLESSREESTDAGVVEHIWDSETRATSPGCTLSAALQRAIASNLHAQGEPAWAITNEVEWDMISTARESSSLENAHAERVTGTRKGQFDSEDQELLSADGEDWEIIYA